MADQLSQQDAAKLLAHVKDAVERIYAVRALLHGAASMAHELQEADVGEEQQPESIVRLTTAARDELYFIAEALGEVTPSELQHG